MACVETGFGPVSEVHLDFQTENCLWIPGGLEKLPERWSAAVRFMLFPDLSLLSNTFVWPK